jgi:aspartate/methionine/tyrosine aminotransferase
MKASIGLPNLTQYERLGISREFNLADGHAHQLQDRAQRQIVRDFPALFAEGESRRQEDVEREFQERFYAVAGQLSAVGHPYTLLCHSASMSIDLVAAFLSGRGPAVGLLSPCFDNLPGILRRRGARLVPVAERDLAGPGLERLLSGGLGALFLTLPNNPTGFVLDEAGFTRVAERCAAVGTVLVVDWTFRFFESLERWDQYAVLARSGVSFLCVEDTGKTWPTLDLKCSVVACSPDLHGALYELHNDLLLNVSPFVLRVLTRYLEDSGRRGLDLTVRRLVGRNRAVLRAALEGSGLSPVAAAPAISVEWVRVEPQSLTSLDVVALLGGAGVAVLPGDHFHWDAPQAGSRFVRFALARDGALFAAACARVRSVLRSGAVAVGGRAW